MVSEITKFPEMLDGRLKSIHPNIFAGILADRKNKRHIAELKKLKISPIDLVVINFYPFEDAVKKNKKLKDVIENIDIGGPALARAAAKNYKDVLVIVDSGDYNSVIEKIKHKKIDETARADFAAKAFLNVARYDVIISRYFASVFLNDKFPEIYNFTFKKIQDLRYGENPHQKAAFYKSFLVKDEPLYTYNYKSGGHLKWYPKASSSMSRFGPFTLYFAQQIKLQDRAKSYFLKEWAKLK